MAYFQDKVDEYITTGIEENVDQFILLKCIEMLVSMKEQSIEPDYLQVYHMSYNEEKNILTIRHSQEEPDFEHEVSFVLPEGVEPYEGKVYYIDDVSHRTFLLADEY